MTTCIENTHGRNALFVELHFHRKNQLEYVSVKNGNLTSQMGQTSGFSLS